jgi:hypothetical protein
VDQEGVIMKKRHVLVIGVVILCVGVALVLNRCSGENMTKVTINFSSNQHAALNSKDSFLEKLKRFFLPEALAITPPPWDPNHTSVVITVTATDLDEPIEATVSPFTESYTMDVPSGSQRLFTVITYDNLGRRNTGGHATADLPQGEVSIQIRMLPIPTGVGSSGGGLDWCEIAGVSGYYIYRSTTEFGPWTKVGTLVGSWPEWFDPEFIIDHWYSVSVYYAAYGEGELSDPWLNNM